MAKINCDKDADVLYVSFGQSEHITGVELADNILLRLDTTKVTGELPRAIGLTFVSFSRTMAHHQDKPLTISLDQLCDLSDGLWQAVIDVVTTSPVRGVLEVGLSFTPQVPPCRCLRAQSSLGLVLDQ
jgi:uncharacterized protein YuzE